MPQSLSRILVHIVFSTKQRQPYLKPDVRNEVCRYMAGILKEHQSPAIEIGGVEDHIHLLCRMSRTITQADLVKELKRVSSLWIKQRDPGSSEFAWQGGYGAFSVSPSALDRTTNYIANQEQHHQKRTVQDEYRALLRKHGMEWDERYVWE